MRYITIQLTISFSICKISNMYGLCSFTLYCFRCVLDLCLLLLFISSPYTAHYSFLCQSSPTYCTVLHFQFDSSSNPIFPTPSPCTTHQFQLAIFIYHSLVLLRPLYSSISAGPAHVHTLATTCIYGNIIIGQSNT